MATLGRAFEWTCLDSNTAQDKTFPKLAVENQQTSAQMKDGLRGTRWNDLPPDPAERSPEVGIYICDQGWDRSAGNSRSEGTGRELKMGQVGR